MEENNMMLNAKEMKAYGLRACVWCVIDNVRHGADPIEWFEEERSAIEYAEQCDGPRLVCKVTGVSDKCAIIRPAK